MRSPFAVFRKHQRISMVILVGMSMFSFVICGAVNDPTNVPKPLVIIAIAALAGGVAWIAGLPQKKSNEYGTWGLILGAVAAVAFTLTSGPPPAVRADTGNLSRDQLLELRRQREAANAFVSQAILATHADRNQTERLLQQHRFGFGIDGSEASERDLVTGELLRREADRLGIDITDDAIDAYIKLITDNKIDEKTFKDLRMRLGLSEPQLYGALRAELKTRAAAEFLLGGDVLPPEVYWNFYRQIYEQQMIEAAAVPVKEFVDTGSEPSRSELEELFARYRSSFPNVTPDGVIEEGRPGFRQPRRVRVASLEVAFDDVKPTVGGVTDAEIEAEYEAKYKKALPPDVPQPGAPGSPEGPALRDPGTTPPDGAGTKPAPEQETEQPPAESGKRPTGTGEPSPDSNGESSCTAQDAAGEADDSAAPAAGAAVQDPAGTPAAAQSSDPGPGPESGAERRAGPDEPPLPQTGVRLLDDALREQIRDELIQQKTFRRMEDMTAAAVDWFVENVGLYVSAPEDSPERLTPEQAAQKVRDYARQQGLHYDETPLMSGEELASSEDHPVGAAVDPHDPRRATVAMIVMTSSPQDLFRPMVAENFVTTSRFVFWKTEDRPGYIPGDLDDERVREQVTETWRMLQARERAKARAEALAQRVRDSVEPMSVALGAETVTGTDKGLFLTVTRTGEFSWLSFPGAQRPNPFSFQPPTLQDPLGIQNAGQDFMRTVFNDLKPGQVGVAPNFDRSIFYVVKVLERTPASEQDFDQFRARFLKEPVFDQLFFPSVYQQLALRTMQEYRSDWVTQLWEKHGAQLTRSGNEG